MVTKKISVLDLQARKVQGSKIVMVTAYDYTFAKIFEEAGVDCLLVGDSLGMVIQGRDNTLPVTMDQMVYHTQCVARGARRAHVICDLPFLSYQTSSSDAIRAAGMALKKGRAESVKLEGGEEMAPTIDTLTRLGIPVMGHVGLMPQRVQQMGGYKIQGRGKEAAKQVMRDAKAVADAGAYALVLEGIPRELAGRITKEISIPTIGIGSGVECDGQVLVGYDLLGMYTEMAPKFVKKYADLHSVMLRAVEEYSREVREGSFPDVNHSFSDAS